MAASAGARARAARNARAATVTPGPARPAPESIAPPPGTRRSRRIANRSRGTVRPHNPLTGSARGRHLKNRSARTPQAPLTARRAPSPTATGAVDPPAPHRRTVRSRPPPVLKSAPLVPTVSSVQPPRTPFRTSGSLTDALAGGAHAVHAAISASTAAVAESTHGAHVRAIKEYIALLATLRPDLDPRRVTNVSLSLAMAAKIAASATGRRGGDPILPATLASWAGSVRAAARRISARFPSWAVADGTPGRAALAAYSALHGSAAVRPSAVAAAAQEFTPRRPVTEACARSMWAAAASDEDRRLVRALVLARALLLRPTELLSLRASFLADAEPAADDDGLPMLVVMVPRYKTGAVHEAAVFTDARDDDPDRVMDPISAWNTLARASGALPFSMGICGRVINAASRRSSNSVNASARDSLRRLARRAGVPDPDKRSFYDGRHTGRPVKAAGFDDILRAQGQWSDDGSSMAVYVVPPLSTVAAKLRGCFRSLDTKRGPAT